MDLLCPFCKHITPNFTPGEVYKCGRDQCGKSWSFPGEFCYDAYLETGDSDKKNQNAPPIFNEAVDRERLKAVGYTSSQNGMGHDPIPIPDNGNLYIRVKSADAAATSEQRTDDSLCILRTEWENNKKATKLIPLCGHRSDVLVNYKRVIDHTITSGDVVTFITGQKQETKACSYICTEEDGTGKLVWFKPPREGCKIKVNGLKASYHQKRTLKDVWKILRGLPSTTKRTVFENVSCEFERGKVSVIIGGSGVGKSTFMSILTGQKAPDTSAEENPVMYKRDSDLNEDNKDYSPKEAAEENIFAYVPQDNALHKELTVKKALYYIAKLVYPDYKESMIRARVTRALMQVGLINKESSILSNLSGGQKKRANIAAGLIEDPKVLFLDEPTSGLDPETELDIMEKIKDLTELHDKTVIIISHSPLVITQADKLFVLHKKDAQKPAELESGTLKEIVETLRVDGKGKLNDSAKELGETLHELYRKINHSEKA